MTAKNCPVCGNASKGPLGSTGGTRFCCNRDCPMSRVGWPSDVWNRLHLAPEGTDPVSEMAAKDFRIADLVAIVKTTAELLADRVDHCPLSLNTWGQLANALLARCKEALK